MRITGLSTGMDTDSMVKQMMKPYTMKIDKMKQDRQLMAWKQELYRDILADTTAMKSTYFDILKPETNMLSKNNYVGFDVTSASSVAGETAGVNASAYEGAQTGNYKVEVIELAKLATSAKISGTAITYPNANKYMTKLSDLGIADGELKFTYKDSNGVQQDNKAITVLATDTISQLMDKISLGTSGSVKLSFSELTNEFSISNVETGPASVLDVTETDPSASKILTMLKLPNTGGVATKTSGTNASSGEVYITPPGGTRTLVTKTSNDFNIDGVNYKLTKIGTTNITVAANAQKPYDKIKSFIDKYNELVDKIGDKIDERKQYKYLPLSDENKAAMKEEEIKQWEIKAKVGLLKGETDLESMLSDMRKAFYDGASDAGISLDKIGLSTSSDTRQRGKIIIDEAKLKSAIETKGDDIANLFAKQSINHPAYNADASGTERNERMKEQGIFQRINDVLQNYTKSTGKKGILIQKSGLKGDTLSFLSKDIIRKDEKINELTRKLAERENKFYLQFSKLETAMNRMNSQSSWLTQQLGGGR